MRMSMNGCTVSHGFKVDSGWVVGRWEKAPKGWHPLCARWPGKM
jgi:hypothetical protein